VVSNPQSPCQPIWGTDTFDQAQKDWGLDALVASLEARGGHPIIGFGGAGATDIALGCTNLTQLENAYLSALTRYKATTIDLDIEGTALDPTADARRAQAILALQQKLAAQHQTLTVWLTVSGRTNVGLQPAMVTAVQAFIHANVQIAGVVVMTGNFTTPADTPDWGKDAVTQLTVVHQQLMTLFPGSVFANSQSAWAHMGASPRIGSSTQDAASKAFTLANAQTLATFADQVGLGRISFWALSRDFQCTGGQAPTDYCSGVTETPLRYSNIFEN